MTQKQFFNLLSKQPVYCINEHEEAVIRTEPGKDGLNKWVKLKGKEEFKAKLGSSLVVDGLIQYDYQRRVL